MPAGLTDVNCSNPQSQRKLDASLKKDKIVHEWIRTGSGFFFDFQGPKSIVSAAQVDEKNFEYCEQGVYITLGILSGGIIVLKHLEFRYNVKYILTYTIFFGCYPVFLNRSLHNLQ